MKNSSLEKEIDDVTLYVASKLKESSHNTKPVLFHSIKVASILYEHNYSHNIIIAALLHDLLEDTDTTYDELNDDFGKEIADIVYAVSFNPSIHDYIEKTKNMFHKCLNYGYDACIVKCADLLDNIDYVNLVEDISKRKLLINKYKLFLDMMEDIIGKEEIYMHLENKYSKMR